MIIAIDFDGTISRGKYPAIEGEQPCAAATLRKLHEDGHYLIINTCRSGDELVNAINWMLERNIPFHRVNDNHPEQTAIYGSNSRKIYAHVYIDDKQILGLPHWDVIYQEITQMEAEYRAKNNE